MMRADFWDYSYSPRVAAFPEGREMFTWKRKAIRLGEDDFTQLPENSSFFFARLCF